MILCMPHYVRLEICCSSAMGFLTGFTANRWQCSFLEAFRVRGLRWHGEEQTAILPVKCTSKRGGGGGGGVSADTNSLVSNYLAKNILTDRP